MFFFDRFIQKKKCNHNILTQTTTTTTFDRAINTRKRKNKMPNKVPVVMRLFVKVFDEEADETRTVAKFFQVDESYMLSFLTLTKIWKIRMPIDLDANWENICLELTTKSQVHAYACMWWYLFGSGRMINLDPRDTTCGVSIEDSGIMPVMQMHHRVLDVNTCDLEKNDITWTNGQKWQDEFGDWIVGNKDEDVLDSIIGNFRNLDGKVAELIRASVEKGCAVFDICM